MSSQLETKSYTLFTFLVALIALLIGGNIAYAQDSETDQGWGEPLNLSRSGLASEPELIVGPSNIVYAFWQNELDGYVISTFQESSWSPPISAEPPFGTRAFDPNLTLRDPIPLFNPTLISNAQVGINAFWINDDNSLQYSRFLEGDVSALASWTLPITLFDNVIKTSGVIDIDGAIHSIFVSNGNGINIKPGIYHVFSNDGGLTWSTPFLIYGSSLFRQGNASQVTLNPASVDGSIQVAFDNPFTEEVYYSDFSISGEGSGVWNTPVLIDSRQVGDGLNSIGPSLIDVAQFQNESHLVWVAGHEGDDCSIYVSRKTSEAEEWSFPIKIGQDLDICPNELELLSSTEQMYLWSTSGALDEIRVYADGKWSSPVEQQEVSSFIDPISLRPVTPTCNFGKEILQKALFVFGCGASNNVNDIWVLTHELDNFGVFDIQSVWSERQIVTAENNLVFDPQIVSSDDDSAHLIWMQNGQSFSGKEQITLPQNAVFYSKFDGTAWSAATNILNWAGMSNGSLSYHPDNDNLLLVWEETRTQKIMFTRASSANAFNAEEWSTPISIPNFEPNPSFPDLAVAPNGSIYVLYAVPFNQGHGLYLTMSDDNGDSWLDPLPILEDVVPFDIFSSPKLQIDENGIAHVIFVNQLTIDDATQNELYYFRSSNSVEEEIVTWQTPRLIQNKFLERQVVLDSDFVSDMAGNIHIVWREWNESQPNLWGVTSNNSGTDWNEPVQISGFGFPVGKLSITHSESQGIHLNQLFLESSPIGDLFTVQHWKRENGSWVIQSPAEIEEVKFYDDNTVFAAGISSGQTLVSVFSGLVQMDELFIQALVGTNVDIIDSATVNAEAPVSDNQAAAVAPEEEVELIADSILDPQNEEVDQIIDFPKEEDAQTFGQRFSSLGSSMVGASIAMIIMTFVLLGLGVVYLTRYFNSLR